MTHSLLMDFTVGLWYFFKFHYLMHLQLSVVLLDFVVSIGDFLTFEVFHS